MTRRLPIAPRRRPGAAALLLGGFLLLTLLNGLPARAAPAGFDTVAERARALAAKPYAPPRPIGNDKLAALSYDDYRDIRYRPAAAWWREQQLPFELQFFHAGRGYAHAVELHEIVDGREQPLAVPKAAFDYGRAAPAMAGESQAQVVGFRVHYAPDADRYKDEALVFQGASYLRAVGSGQHYGLSARGIAVDTVGGPGGEEFPAFTAFWLERPAKGATALVIHALLDGPRITGAYRFTLRPGVTTEIDVKARLFLRAPVATLGIAPLTSMFLGGENQPQPLQALGDFRPEVHDSDGLQIETASGEWIWRPLVNPKQPFTTSFALQRGPRGFGLMQRDREFRSYEDPEARYDRRPSVWIAPSGDWGAGRVELMQFHTPDETNDNVVAYWVPARQPARGEPYDIAYTLRWQGEQQQRPRAGRVLQSRFGRSHAEPADGELQFNIDFAAAGRECKRGADGAPELRVTTGDNARLLLKNAYRHPLLDDGWRATLKVQRLDRKQPVELRAFLACGDDVLTETWSYALPPE